MQRFIAKFKEVLSACREQGKTGKDSIKTADGPPRYAVEKARGFIEKMEYQDDTFTVSGWMLLPGKKFDSFALYLNQKRAREIKLIEREDVAQVFPFIQHAARSGFKFELHRKPEEMAGMIDVLIMGMLNGKQIAKLETLFRTDMYSFPAPPVHLIDRVAAIDNPSFFLILGLQTYGEFWKIIRKYRNPRSIKRMLDWGCGCGRVTGFFLKFSGIPEISGCDIDAEPIRWCRDHLGPGKFSVCPLYPPTPYADNSFDLIISFSVFTHLSKDVQIAWLKEMRRILAPGGIFLTTVHGEFAASFGFPCEKLGEVLKDGFYSSEDGKLDGIAPAGYYRGTFQTKEYTLKEWSRYFQILEYEERGGGNYQDLIVMQKRLKG
jgi:SAM-dependent methyltransferase